MIKALSKCRQLIGKAKREGRLLPVVIEERKRKVDEICMIVRECIKNGYVCIQENQTFKYEGCTDAELQELICSIVTVKRPRGTKASTVRWARFNLSSQGFIEDSGKRRDRATVWKVKDE